MPSAPEAALVLPATSVCVAVRLCAPSATCCGNAPGAVAGNRCSTDCAVHIAGQRDRCTDFARARNGRGVVARDVVRVARTGVASSFQIQAGWSKHRRTTVMPSAPEAALVLPATSVCVAVRRVRRHGVLAVMLQGATVTLTSDVDGAVGTATVAGDGTWSITASTLADGAHSLTATQTDVAGNTSAASGALGITVDTAVLAPAGLDLEAASDTGSSNTDNITGDNTPTISGTGEVGATVTLTSDVDGAVGTATVAGDGTWSITASTLADGAHSLTATQTDVAGNTSAASGALGITVDTAVLAPAGLDLEAASDTGSSNTDNITGDNTPTISGTGEVGATITLTSDVDGAVGTATVAGDGTWSITASTLADGAHSLTATQTDVAGNTSAASGALGITVDTTVLAPASPGSGSCDTGSSTRTTSR